MAMSAITSVVSATVSAQRAPGQVDGEHGLVLGLEGVQRPADGELVELVRMVGWAMAVAAHRATAQRAAPQRAPARLRRAPV